ncbi:hypothetical protein SAY87_012786 [Trapa incisa]|uniref:Uncharacterized protein n=1 Tax=Trapa incisa TaxID=236973 RepID=A0AAN7GY98_9MYRT|nr:hypothetical protein SAY87_012786 [Trapa incisa]
MTAADTPLDKPSMKTLIEEEMICKKDAGRDLKLPPEQHEESLKKLLQDQSPFSMENDETSNSLDKDDKPKYSEEFLHRNNNSTVKERRFFRRHSKPQGRSQRRRRRGLIVTQLLFSSPCLTHCPTHLMPKQLRGQELIFPSQRSEEGGKRSWEKSKMPILL